MQETELKFKLKNAVSPYDGRPYIGFVCDVLNKYFNLKSKCYLLSASGGDISRSNLAVMLISENRRVKVIKCEEDMYLVSGLPSDKNFKDFKDSAQRDLEELLKSIRKLDNQRFSQE